jgi:hypothetical protein
MVFINIGPLGRWEVNRIPRPESSSSDTKEQTSIDAATRSVNDLPPLYDSTSPTVDSEVIASTNTPQDEPKSGMFDFFWRRDNSLTRAPTATQRHNSDPDRRLNLGPSFFLPAQNEKEQLRRYLLEILTFIFGADYDSLHSTLNDQTHAIAESTTSILFSSERKDLLRLSQAVNTLLQKTPQTL